VAGTEPKGLIMASVIAMAAGPRSVVVTLSLAALAAWIFLSFGRLGFNPTDDGYMLAYSHRLLRGEMPHRDFSSPAPVGSPLRHLLDWALPLPLLEASRLVAVVEMGAYSAWLATLTFGRPLSGWGPLPPARPCLTIDLWDGAETGVPRPGDTAPEPGQRTWRVAGGFATSFAGGRALRNQHPHAVTWLELGSDLEDIPRAVTGLLSEARA
jgi:hypothetical protein